MNSNEQRVLGRILAQRQDPESAQAAGGCEESRAWTGNQACADVTQDNPGGLTGTSPRRGIEASDAW